MKGDQGDMAGRILRILPQNWFPDDAPNLNALLQGLGAGLAAIYSQISFAALQTRIATATGAFLDMAALDYLGGRLVRKPGQSDASFSARIRAEIVRPRITRAGLIQALTDLTGRTPWVFESARPPDTGGYGVAMGYGVAGGYGSLALPSQVFVRAYRATGGGIANVGGYYAGSGWAGGGYGVGAIEYGAAGMGQGQITDADIYAAAASVMPAGGIAWTNISS